MILFERVEKMKKGITSRKSLYFYERFEINADGCWVWVIDGKGEDYGQFMVDGKRYKAHRYSYEIHKGAIPEGMYVCHTCDNPPCVNPDHLWLGTNADNVRDMNRKNRNSQNRDFTEEQRYQIVDYFHLHYRKKGDGKRIIAHLTEKYDSTVNVITNIIYGTRAHRKIASRPDNWKEKHR
jgi:hypothetical protein